MKRCACALLLACALDLGCARDEAWRRAEAQWAARAPDAYAAWQALDPRSGDGARARERLRRADEQYRRGIALLADGRVPEARALLSAAAAQAPIDPALYLPLARVSAARGLTARAADFYRKFLLARPGDGAATAARAELAALRELDVDLLAPVVAPPATNAGAALVLALAALLALALLVAATLVARRRRGGALQQLAAANPELQPAIAFLVGCLRHELLKHRILATRDAADALAQRPADADARKFLLARLYGGEPLRVAWAGHLSGFLRVLGPRFNLLRHDPLFAEADRAIAALAADERALKRGDSGSWARLLRLQSALADFDAQLGTLTARLSNSRVDQALLDEIVAGVQRELGPRGASVDVAVAAVAPGIAVELFRFDLVLIVKNVVRNAIAAAATGAAPRRVAIDVAVAVEPTGEEVVRVRVRDSNRASLPAPAAPTRGLGLVTTTLDRYDGCISVEPAEGDYAKAVVIRLFRALDAAAEAA